MDRSTIADRLFVDFQRCNWKLSSIGLVERCSRYHLRYRNRLHAYVSNDRSQADEIAVFSSSAGMRSQPTELINRAWGYSWPGKELIGRLPAEIRGDGKIVDAMLDLMAIFARNDARAKRLLVLSRLSPPWFFTISDLIPYLVPFYRVDYGFNRGPVRL